MDIDRKNWKMLADEMEAALRPLLEKHGLEVGKVSGQYGYTVGAFRFQVQQTASASADGKSNGQRDFERSADLLGLDPAWFGQTVRYQRSYASSASDQITIDGLSLGSRKFPVLATTASGRRMKYTTRGIRQAFKNAGWDVPFSWRDDVVPPLGLVETPRPEVADIATA
jgi:hypothetical protein